MKRWLTSLRGRLLLIAFASTLAALLFAGFAIGHVLERVVMRSLDDRLDAQIMVLARAVRPDGTLDSARAIDLPNFGVVGSGWAWRVDGPAGSRTSAAGAPDLPRVEPPHPDRDEAARHDRNRRDKLHPRDDIRPGEIEGPAGERLHSRQLVVATPAGSVTIAASGPRRVVAAPLREAMLPLLASLGILGFGLALATLVQLRFGLRPLGRLRIALADVRAGRLRHVPADQPEELAGVVSELNALIDQNEAGLAAARRHVSNLAHGMKTPLAALALKLGEDGRDPDGSLSAMVAEVDSRVRHHLGRARAATPAGRSRTRTPLAPAVADLAAVLDRLHADRPVTTDMHIPADLSLAVDPQDLDEMLGNLLDNARRHARTALAVTAASQGSMATIRIEDDGPGLTDAAMRDALVPGQRLDEAGEGYGFGLSIVQELAELNGGTLALARSARAGWGLAVTLTLPLSS
ncbi:sensor histidine kinase [Sphingomonas sp. GB1N7]|uniref:sensor histidine kinase n=1 Tax=Parasphingomonas caseinilytica TaxID=3096158 RepID=UPI002FC6D4AF